VVLFISVHPISLEKRCSGTLADQKTAVVISLNPQGMGIGEWVILFSENFGGLGMGMGMGMSMGNSKKLCA